MAARLVAVERPMPSVEPVTRTVLPVIRPGDACWGRWLLVADPSLPRKATQGAPEEAELPDHCTTVYVPAIMMPMERTLHEGPRSRGATRHVRR